MLVSLPLLDIQDTRSHRWPQRALANQTGEWDLQRPNKLVIRSEELFNALGQTGTYPAYKHEPGGLDVDGFRSEGIAKQSFNKNILDILNQ